MASAAPSAPFSPLASRGSALRSVGLSPHLPPPSPYRLHDEAAAHRLASPVADLLAQRWASVVIRLGPDAFNDWADRALPELVATGGAFATLRWLLAEGPADY
jgi:hypothetical protein